MLRTAVTAAGTTVLLLLATASPAQTHYRVAFLMGVPPGDSLFGKWRSSRPGVKILEVFQGAGDSTFVATGPDGFQAQCFIDGTNVVGIARFGSPVNPAAKDWARYILLTASWSDPVTLQVKWTSPLTGAVQSEETWRYAGPGITGPADVGSESLPRLGDYVFVEELPEAVDRVAPDYPTWAREKGVQGTVMVQALVGRDGRVKDVKVMKSIPMLDDYAVAAVKQWRFKPARSKGEPVAVWVGVPVKFSLH